MPNQDLHGFIRLSLELRPRKMMEISILSEYISVYVCVVFVVFFVCVQCTSPRSCALL